MHIGLPQNFFAEQIKLASEKLQLPYTFTLFPSAVLGKKLKWKEVDAALLPTFDLINAEELFVSSKLGLAFDGIISNTYLYFQPGEQDIKQFGLLGDVSTTDSLMLKILSKEMYNSEIELLLLSEDKPFSGKAVLLAGNGNFEEKKVFHGLSMTEEVIEMLSLPYVANMFAARDRESLLKIESDFKGIEDEIYRKIEDPQAELFEDLDVQNYIVDAYPHVIYELDSEDLAGADQLLRMPYFHGFIEDIPELKFTDQ